MVLDKFRVVPLISKISPFVVFGSLNFVCYGLSKLMNQEDYKNYFAFTGNGKYSQIMRSLIGSDKLGNVIWTAPSLILCGQYMHMKVGALTMLKFFGLSLAATIAFYQAFSPNSDSKFLQNYDLLRRFFPGISSHDK